MSCAKCGGLTAIVTMGDFFEEHDAIKCLTCGWVGWVNPVPYARPECSQWDCDLTK